MAVTFAAAWHAGYDARRRRSTAKACLALRTPTTGDAIVYRTCRAYGVQ
jgi:hypothetical protein